MINTITQPGNYPLIVIAPFGGYQVGDSITDAKDIAAANETNPSNVVAIAMTVVGMVASLSTSVSSSSTAA